MKQKLVEQGVEPVGSTPEAFGRMLREEVTRWAEVVRISGAKAE
jgi:tripartite-type tricarboxylate transporter receptor subunit TctC